MKAKIKINGVLTDVEIHDNGDLTIIEREIKRTGWERVCKGGSFYSNGAYDSLLFTENEHEPCELDYELANYFSDKKLAADICRAQTMWRKIARWQAENDAPVDWRKKTTWKYFIIYDYSCGILGDDIATNINYGCPVYFSDKTKVDEAMDLFRDDLIWYFTKFKPRRDI